MVRSIGAETEEGSCFIRVRVKIDITKALCHGRLITLENGEKTWVVFKYERLPNFCFWCGRLSHGNRDCPSWIQSKGTLLMEGDRQFELSLRAALYNPTNQKVIYVPSFYDKSSLKKDVSLRRENHGVNGVVRNKDSEERVARNSNMETEEFGADINAALNAEKSNGISSESETEIRVRVNKLESKKEA